MNNYEWYTPKRYMKLVHDVLGEIDFDPCSNETANKTVQAKRYLTINDNALTTPWDYCTTVYMNPPYSRDLLPKFVDVFIDYWNDPCSFREAIVLTNNNTETVSWQKLAKHCSVVCNVDHRISFIDQNGNYVFNNTRGQTFFYFGYDARKFVEVFSTIGQCMVHPSSIY